MSMTMSFFKKLWMPNVRHLSIHQKIHFPFQVSRNTLKSTAYVSVQIQSGMPRVSYSRWKVYLHPYYCNRTCTHHYWHKCSVTKCKQCRIFHLEMQPGTAARTKLFCSYWKAVGILSPVYWQLWDFSGAPPFSSSRVVSKIATSVSAPICKAGDGILQFQRKTVHKDSFSAPNCATDFRGVSLDSRWSSRGKNALDYI